MQHLGDRVTAVVDDALDERERAGVQDHLLACEQCSEAVRRERHLKSRMTCTPMSPTPSAALVAALADRRVLADHVARQERRRTAAVHAVVTAGGLGAALAVLGLCMGGSSPLQGRQAAASTGGLRPAATLVTNVPGPVGLGAYQGVRNGLTGRRAASGSPNPAPVFRMWALDR